MEKKYKCPINLAYFIYTDEFEDKTAMTLLFRRLPEYFKRLVNNKGYDIYVSRNADTLIINIRGAMTVDFTLVDTSSADYHYEADGESSFDCMTREDFDQIVIGAFEECANDIIDTDIYECDGSHVKTVYLSDSIGYHISDYNKDVGYPCEEDIWELVA